MKIRPRASNRGSSENGAESVLDVIGWSPYPKGPPECEVFERLVSEITIACGDVAKTPKKEKELKDCLELSQKIQSAILNEEPANAAINAFALAVEIAKAKGIKEASRVLERADSMSIEIDHAVEALEQQKKKITPSLVWQKLIERCGQAGSYCAQWRHETDASKDVPVIVWFGVQGNQERLTYKALTERLRRRKK